MVLNFIAPSTRHPSGGVAAIYEFASAMARRGHQVHLHHADFFQANVTSLDDIGWFSFASDDVRHHFPTPGAPDVQRTPAADVIFGFSSESEMPAHAGLPVVLIQGYKMLGEVREHHAFRAPCPKVCVAAWLVDVGRQLGVPAAQLVHVPYGLRHDKYRLGRPLAGRPLRVSVCYNAHFQKRAQLALEVLARVVPRVPRVEVIMFGALAPAEELPSWVTYRTNPPQQELVDDIYNASRVFLCTSEVEGFGLTSIEAMACGAALVTTDNGGSRDYAVHGQTALVAPTGDVDTLVEQVVGLLTDDRMCASIASAGREYVERFDWDRSGALLEAFLERYVADPIHYGRPR